VYEKDFVPLHVHFESMNKKIYLQPTLEIMPLGMVQTLCTSGGGGGGTGGIGGGLDPEEFGRAPRHTAVF